MSRRPRVVVPDTEADEGIAEPQVIEIPEAGDLEHLANAEDAWRWVVYRKLRPEERGQLGGALRVMLCKLEGPVDIEQVRRDYGGGTFEFWGTLTGSNRLRVRHEITMAGPLKPAVLVEAPPSTTAAANLNGAVSSELVKVLERMDAKLERLSQPPPAAQPGITMQDVIGLLPLLRGHEPDPKAQIEGMLGLVRTGIELGTQREPGEPPDPGMVVLEKVLPSVDRLLTTLFARRAGPPRPPTAQPTEATVVTDSPPPPAPPTQDEVDREHRLNTLVGSLARAIAQGVEVPDFADTVERILPDDEVFMLKQYDAAQLMAEIQSRTGDRYPTLQNDYAKQYVAELLSELRNPTTTEPDEA
jgi:hypothetical protein